jgi:glycosyltransferase involved in cell wall biosynthesis
VPLIVISYNRGAMLRRVIASYRRQTVPVEIVVHDNGSTEPATLEALDELERDGVCVSRRAPISSADELNRVNETVSAVFACREPGPYIVTDCDVDLAGSIETIATYLRLLNAFPEAECVGPMLRIDDIRKSYPLFGRVMNLHIRQFWRRRPKMTKVDEQEIAYIRASIDTTFAVHRSTHAFRRLKSGIRVYAPFDGRHLDWYPHELADGGETKRAAYRRSSSSAISHWGNQAYANEFSSERPKYRSYNVVTRLPSGRLQLARRRVADNPD